MFTGIIETIGTVTALHTEAANLHLTVASGLSDELKIDQSIAHNGCCLTVVAQQGGAHTVTAIAETLQKTNLGTLVVGSPINLERCVTANSRIDGHFVQGHIDQTAECIGITEAGGSWYVQFGYTPSAEHILVPKGSITIDGTSLTLVEAQANTFTVAIIPYTYQHTLFGQYKLGSIVNIEFDIIGKYLTALFNRQAANLLGSAVL